MENVAFDEKDFYNIPPIFFSDIHLFDSAGNKSITIQDVDKLSPQVCIHFIVWCNVCYQLECPLTQIITSCTLYPGDDDGGNGNGGVSIPTGGPSGGGPIIPPLCPGTGTAPLPFYKTAPGAGTPCTPIPPLPPVPVSVTTVTVDLHQQCLVEAYNKITSNKLKNALIRMYMETYVGTGNVHNLLIEEVSYIPDSQNPGVSLLSQSTADVADPTTWVIDLSGNYEHQFTQELWGSIIYHELVHSFIKKNNLGFDPFSVLDQAHKTMLNKWISQLRDAIKEAFNIPLTDALALSLEGFDDILKDPVTHEFKPEMVVWIQGLYGQDLGAASTLAQDYYTGAKGTRCPQ